MGQRYSQSAEPQPDGPLVRFFRQVGEKTELLPERGWLPRGVNPVACYVESGWTNRVHHDEEGRPAITATYIPGDFINLDTLCEEEPLGRICALTPSTVLCVQIPDLNEAMRKDHVLTLDLVQRIAAEADWLREALMAMARLNSRDRIIYYFGQMRRRQICFGTLDRNANHYEMPITQRHLATMVGISTIHANRLTRDLDDSGLLTLRSKSITIPDIPRFEQVFADLTLPI